MGFDTIEINLVVIVISSHIPLARISWSEPVQGLQGCHTVHIFSSSQYWGYCLDYPGKVGNKKSISDRNFEVVE